MDAFSELIDGLQADLNLNDNSTFPNLITQKLAINRAYRKVGGLFLWPALEDAQKTSSVASQEYYDYPDTWRADSIWKLVVDSVDYGDPLLFKDYLYEKEEDIPSNLDYLWANQARRYFIYPTPTTNGNNNIEIWGFKVVTALSADADQTIFSESMPEVNEAIVLEAGAILKAKGDEEKRGEFRSMEAKQIILVAWSKISKQQAKQEKTQPMFEVQDMFAGRRKGKDNNYGRF